MAGFAGTWRGAGHAPNPAPASRSQILSNLVMEELGPELKAELVPRLKGKPQERQRQWIQVGGLGSGVGVGGPRLPGTPSWTLTPTPMPCPQISDAVYRMVYEQAKARFEAVLSKLQLARPAMEAVIRTDMDQIITSKEHLASKIRGRWATCSGWHHGVGGLGPPTLGGQASLLPLSGIHVHVTAMT